MKVFNYLWQSSKIVFLKVTIFFSLNLTCDGSDGGPLKLVKVVSLTWIL